MPDPGWPRLRPYLPRIALDWLAEHPETTHRRFPGTLLFVDVSGFTALTERLAARGKQGAEEITGVIGSVFGQLVGIAASYGADLLKWGGDAVLLYFPDPGSPQRAGRAALEMTAAMDRMKAFRTSAGRVNLAVSIGAHSGDFDLYLLGHPHRELVVTGPEASVTARMEAAADAGEVVISPETAGRLDPRLLGAPKGGGVLLAAAPDADQVSDWGRPPPADGSAELDAEALLPADTRSHLLGGGETSEHRQATVAFLEFSGIDELTRQGGGALVAHHLEPVVSAAATAAQRYLVNFKETDIGPDGGKIVIVGGVPKVRGNDAERVLRAVLDVVTNHPSSSPVRLRAGVNFGRVFVFSHEFELARRRVFATTGDAMNLAARVMGKSSPGQVWATEAVLSRVRNPFDTEDVAPFAVKGKSAPVSASIVVGPRFAMGDHRSEDALPFVGRARQMAAILERAEHAASGSGSVVEIAGPPGIGKSRIVSEAISRWSLNTLRVPCEDYGSATPYLPFQRIFHALIGISDTTAPDVAATELRRTVRALSPNLEAYLPLLGDVAGIAVASTRQVDELDGKFRRARLERSVVELVKAYLSGPSCLVFEDAHSMDEASMSLLERIATETARLPLLIVLTRGPEQKWAIPDTIPATTIDLQPLDSDDATDLAGAAARAAGGGSASALPPAQLQAIVERANGNPLFLRELLRAAGGAGGIEELPETLEPLLVAAIDLLEPPERQVLRAAAVLGARFDPDILRHLLDKDALVDAASLDRLSAFVVPAGHDWRFSHGLVRDAAYEGLSFKRRRELHARAAVAIEATSGPNGAVELLSRHWMHAEHFDRAWEYSRAAGDKARALWANADAVAFYDRAMRAASHLRLPPADVFAVAEALGDTSEVAARYDGARRAYLRARRLCRQQNDRARLLRKTGILYERQGRYPEALNCYTRARRLVEGTSAPEALERCELSLAAAGIRERQGRYRESLNDAQHAGQEAQAAGYLPGMAHALYLQQMISDYLGVAADHLGHRSLAIYEELGDLVGQGNALNNLGISAYYAGHWTKALECYERSREMRIRSGDVVGAATAENNIAEILSDQGELAGAQPLLESARATWSATGYRIGAAFATSNLGRLRARQGDIDAGRQLLIDALGEFTAIKSQGSVAETRLRLYECDVLAGRFAGAAESLRNLLDEIRAKPGYEQIETSALRLLAVAAAMGDNESGAGGYLAAAAEKASAIDNPYELALALATRTVLSGHGMLDARTTTNEDARRAESIFAALGVTQAVITWSYGPAGGPLYAYRAG